MITNPPHSPSPGQVHREDSSYWRWTKGEWVAFEPSENERLSHAASEAAEAIDTELSIAGALQVAIHTQLNPDPLLHGQGWDPTGVQGSPCTVSVCRSIEDGATGYLVKVESSNYRIGLKTNAETIISDMAISDACLNEETFNAWMTRLAASFRDQLTQHAPERPKQSDWYEAGRGGRPATAMGQFLHLQSGAPGGPWQPRQAVPPRGPDPVHFWVDEFTGNEPSGESDDAVLCFRCHKAQYLGDDFWVVLPGAPDLCDHQVDDPAVAESRLHFQALKKAL